MRLTPNIEQLQRSPRLNKSKMEILDKVNERSKAASRVQEAQTREAIESFIQHNHKIRKTRAAVKEQEAK